MTCVNVGCEGENISSSEVGYVSVFFPQGPPGVAGTIGPIGPAGPRVSQ